MMKKIIALALGLLFALNITLADVVVGDRITTYDDGNQIVGERGYVDVSNWNYDADVFVCKYKDETKVSYGMNLQNINQIAQATELVTQLAQMSFAEFDHYGCKRARI